jgi:16S rRNA (guanine1207-N2)-methyltransferase
VSVDIQSVIAGIRLELKTAPSLFSPTAVDQGSVLLLTQVELHSTDKVLDLGCGYGVMGIYAAKRCQPENVYMVDSDPLAIEFATINANINGVSAAHVQCSDGFANFREAGFTKILCNPPYHTDFSVAKHFIEKGFNRLAIGGEMWMVTKREKWYRNKLTSIFGGVRLFEQDSYFVFRAIKKQAAYAKRSAMRA